MGIQDSINYTDGLQEHARNTQGSGLKGDVLLGAGIASFAHWQGNRKRKKMGLPQEPMSKWLGLPIAASVGWLFWWVPFAVYIGLDYAVGHMHWISFFLTVGVFITLFHFWKKHRAKKYTDYYAAQERKAWSTVVEKPANIHAPGSSEWLSEAGSRMRKNVGL